MRTNINKYRNSKKRTADDDDDDDDDDKAVQSPVDLASHEDALTEILLRLPIPSLLRSKCVSKHWRSLISHHRFALLRNPNPNPPLGIFLQRLTNDGSTPQYDFVSFHPDNTSIKPPFKTLNFHPNPSNSGIMILHSSNGLMLCYSLHEHLNNASKEIEYNAMYYVYNPTINQYVTLPKPTLDGYDWSRRRPVGMTLAFDPVKSPHYKVICVQSHLLSDHLYSIAVYSSENRSWRMSGEPFSNQNDTDTEFTGGVYWNDAVHWISKKGYILYLKVNEGVLDRIRGPTVLHAWWDVKRHCYPLVESRDSLLFIDTFLPLGVKFDVYEMGREYAGWVVKYYVDLTQVMTKIPAITGVAVLGLGYNRPLPAFVIHGLVVGEREEDAFLVLEGLGKVIRYNIVLRSYQELCDFDLLGPFRLLVADDGFSKLGRWPGAFLYFESLSHV